MANYFFDTISNEKMIIEKSSVVEWSGKVKKEIKNQKDPSGRNLLQLLFLYENVNDLEFKINFCLENGLDPYSKDKLGKTSFDYAFSGIEKKINITYLDRDFKINEERESKEGYSYTLLIVYKLLNKALALMLILPENLDEEKDKEIIKRTKDVIFKINKHFKLKEPLCLDIKIEKIILSDIFRKNLPEDINEQENTHPLPVKKKRL